MALSSAGSQAATPPLLRQFCETGSAAGQCKIPRGIAVDPATGNAFIADQTNDRIVETTAWGAFVRAWGWDVVLSGPDETAEDQLETCIRAKGDVCKAGVKGGGRGQLVRPQGLAVDSAGGLFVAEGNFSNRRVQKFDVPPDPEEPVSFELMFGGDVNKTKVEEAKPEAEQNLCPVDPADVCQAATQGTGEGQFGAWVAGSFVAIDPGPPEVLYVGDRERIQEFDTGGHYLGDLPDPDEVLKGKTVQALAFDQGEDGLYVGLGTGVEDVPRLDSTSGEEQCKLEVERPSAVASGVGEVWVVSAEKFATPPTPMQLVRFDPVTCGETDRFNAEDEGFSASTGLALSSPPTCGLAGNDLFLSNSDESKSFVKLYGPPPDPEVCPPPAEPPLISDQFATSVGASGATVRAQINPRFWPNATYLVQYGTGKCSEGGCKATAPLTLTEAVLNAPVATKGVFLEGLVPETVYHYRFLATSEGGGPVAGIGGGEETGPEEFLLEGEESTFTTFGPPLPVKEDCPNQVFRTGLAAPLPDCRAYELVSPLDKDNGDIETSEAFQLASPDGDRATYSSLRAFGEPQSAPLTSQYLSSRDPSAGWRTHSISPPRESVAFYPPGEPANKFQFKAFSEDLCRGWLLQDTDIALAEGAPPGVANVYRRDDRDCGAEGYSLLTPVPPPGFSFKAESPQSTYFPETQGISADGSRTLLRVDAELTPDACGEIKAGGSAKGIFQLYLHYPGPEPNGQLRLLSVLPSGDAACVHSSAGTAQGLEGSAEEDSVYHAISNDGSRVFWSTDSGPKRESPAPGGGNQDQTGPLYLRLNPEGPEGASGECKAAEAGEACTALISEAADTRFRGADPGGHTAVYTAEGGLHEYDVDAEAKTTIAAEGVIGVMGMSEDTSRVYFVSSVAIPGAGPNGLGAEAIPGKPNLYLHEHGAGESFVATLSGRDAQDAVNTNVHISPIATLPDRRTSRISADGLHAAFASDASPTGYDNADAVSGEPDAEVYLYDAVPGGGAGGLACLSCNPSGARPRGRETVTPYWAAAQIPGWPYQLAPSRALAEDGGRLFFESTDALVPRDTNGKQDVYEWERAGGRAACEALGAEAYAQGAGGCLSLISAGKGGEDSRLLDASEGGADVFLTTETSLLPEDFGLVDVYDARVGGGFPPPPAPAPPCEGEACQPYPAPPAARTPGSESFQGPGNLVPGCAGPARRAKRLAKRSRALRRAAKRSPGKGAARKRRAARRLAAKAKRLRKSARRCRVQRKREASR